MRGLTKEQLMTLIEITYQPGEVIFSNCIELEHMWEECGDGYENRGNGLLLARKNTIWETIPLINHKRRVDVSKEQKEVLDKLSLLQGEEKFDLIDYFSSFTKGSQKYESVYTEDFKVLENIPPLLFARALLIGYDTEEEG